MGKLNLSALSDAELEAIASGKSSTKDFAPPDMAGLSDDQLESIAQGHTSLANIIPEREEIKKPAMTNPADEIESPLMRGIVKAGQFVDKFTGAPMRNAISEAQDGRSPVSGFASQFGKNPWTAPTGQDIARKAGVSDDPLIPDRFRNDPNINPLLGSKLDSNSAPWTRSGVVGTGIDVAADPLIVGAPMVKGAVSVARPVAKLGAKAVGALARTTRTGEKVADTVSTVSKFAKGSAQDAAGAFDNIINPSRAPGFNEMVNVAVKNGIDPKLLPESVEFGDTSLISRMSRSQREGLLGQPRMERFREGLAQVQQATDRKIQNISGGYVPKIEEAGDIITKGYDDAVDRLFQDSDVTHNYIISAAPGLLVDGKQMQSIQSKLSGIEKFAKGRSMRGITKTQREQGLQLLRAVDAAKRGNGSYKQLYEAMSDIGEVAFKKKGNSLADIPADQEKMQDLYFTIRDSLVDTAGKRLGPDIQSKLMDSNAKISNFLKTSEPLKSVIGNSSSAPERVFRTLVESGDTRKIKAVKDTLSPEQVQQLKGAFIENLVKRDPDGSFNFGRLHSALRNKRPLVEALFEPQEIAELGELIQLGDRFGPSVLSTSGTGASLSFGNIREGAERAIFNDTALDTLKDRARNKGLNPPGPKPVGEAIKKGAKASQVMSVENETAMQRRLKETK